MKRSKKQGVALAAAALLMVQSMGIASAGMGEVDYSGLPGRNARLHWDAVGTAPKADAEAGKAAATQAPKAVPIIITAADIDAQKKAGKKSPAEVQPAVLPQPPVAPPAPAVQPQPAPVVAPAKTALPAGNVVELPPIQAVEVKLPAVARPAAAKPVVELPPIEKVPAAAASKAQTVELPPIQPVK